MSNLAGCLNSEVSSLFSGKSYLSTGSYKNSSCILGIICLPDAEKKEETLDDLDEDELDNVSYFLQ